MGGRILPPRSDTPMAGRDSYKRTLFDREGPDAGLIIKVNTRAVMAGGISLPIVAAFAVKYNIRGVWFIAFMIAMPIAIGFFVRTMLWRMMTASETAVRVVLEGGASTPYTEQYSYQQTLVMQGRLNEALESYEAIIAEPDSTLDVRIRAAELYVREAKNHERAAELLQEVIRHQACTPGEEIYAANRLADLLSNHLGEPGKALVQLRRLADRYTGTPTGDRAREAIRALKSIPRRDDETTPGPTVGVE
jgi:hypothetical protein